MLKQMFLHTFSSLTILSQITFVKVPSWTKLLNSLPNILHFTLITVQKIDQTYFIAIKSKTYYVSLSSHSAGKSWCLINIYTDLTAFSTTLIGSFDSFRRVKFSSYEITTKLSCSSELNHRFMGKHLFNFIAHIKKI